MFFLKIVSERVDILVDNEFVTSKQSGLPKYGSARLSTSTPGRLLNQIFEVYTPLALLNFLGCEY